MNFYTFVLCLSQQSVMSDKAKYVLEQYCTLDVCEKNGDWNFSGDEWFNPNIHPSLVKPCSQCESDYNTFKQNKKIDDMEVIMKHPKSCLWYYFFANKVKFSWPSAKIVQSAKDRNVSKEKTRTDFSKGGQYNCYEGGCTRV